MWKEAIRDCNKAAKETELTVKIQKPNTRQWQNTNTYKNM